MTRRQGPVSPNSQHRSRSSVRVLTGLFCFALCLPAAWVQAADITPTRSVTANGMTVLFLEQHFLPTVEIHTLVKVGSAQDPPDKTGLANLTANLLDEGTLLGPPANRRTNRFRGRSLEAMPQKTTPPLRHACSKKMRTSGLHS